MRLILLKILNYENCGLWFEKYRVSYFFNNKTNKKSMMEMQKSKFIESKIFYFLIKKLKGRLFRFNI